MDFTKTDRSEAVKTQSLVISASIISIITVTLLLIVSIILLPIHKVGDPDSDDLSSLDDSENVDVDTGSDPSNIPADNPDGVDNNGIKEIKPVDFQPIVDEWAGSLRGNRSVLIYDLDTDEIVGSFNPDEFYSIASLYKLFVVYAGYEKLQTGEWNSDDMAGRTGLTVLECLDLAIRESNSVCAESLWTMIGREELQEAVVSEYGAINTSVSGFVSNANDILNMMKVFYNHETIKEPSLVSVMKDSFLNQPITEYNWRQGLPSGFTRANVYNKVGWDYNPEESYWNLYHDAAIVEFPEENRHFIVVVMTNRVPFQRIRDLGTMIEETFYNNQ